MKESEFDRKAHLKKSQLVRFERLEREAEKHLLKTYGDYTIVGLPKHEIGSGPRKAIVQCNLCKTQYTKVLSRVINGNNKACRSCASSRSNKTHGETGKTALYHHWLHVRLKCRDRGYEWHEPWHDYLVFKRWALKRGGYKEGLALRRFDISKGFNPDNCRYASGTSNFHLWKGEYLTLDEIIQKERPRVTKKTIIRRLERKWTLERALTQKPRKDAQRHEHLS